MLSKLFLALFAAVSMVSGATINLEQRQIFNRPSLDSFYKPPSGWQGTAPGTILRSRKAGKLYGLDYNAAYQLLYRTTDSLGNPTTTVTTVIIPANADFNKFVSYQIFYDSVNVDCSPSYTLTQVFSLKIDDGVKDLLKEGFIVNTPDYEGPQAAFTAGVISGQATLDSIRAALASTSITGIKSTAKYAMWGYSGGALASEWAAELASSYAPELTFAGVALGGLTPNVRTVAFTINNGAFAGLLPAGVIGLATQYPDAQATLNQVLLPQYALQFNAAKTRCLADQITAGAFVDYSKYFRGGLSTIDLPASQKAIRAGGTMGLHGTPRTHLYVYKGVNDQVSPVSDTDDLVNKYCAAGVQIQYKRDYLNDHLTELAYGKSGAIKYLKTVLSGGATTNNCGKSGFLGGIFGREEDFSA